MVNERKVLEVVHKIGRGCGWCPFVWFDLDTYHCRVVEVRRLMKLTSVSCMLCME